MSRVPVPPGDYSVPLVRDGGWVAPAPGVVVAGVHSRLGADLEPVLYPGSRLPPSFEAYRMFRGVCLAGDESWLEGAGIRYDITVLAGRWPCPEPVKTLGHVHSSAGPGGITYPELYQVLDGRGLFLMQAGDRAALVEALPGQVVWVPPGFGHVTLNPGPGHLVMANLIAAACRSIYEPFTGRGGAAWHMLLRDGELVPVENRLHEVVIPLDRLPAPGWNRSFGPLLEGGPDGGCMYTWACGRGDVIAVLTCPAPWWDPGLAVPMT